MKKIVSLLTLALLFSISSFGQSNDEYKQTVRTMFKISGSEGAFTSALDQMFTMFKAQYPSVKESTWGDLKKEFDATSMDDLVELLVPIYQKHLTLEDVNGVIAFYNTPAGKKYADKTPLIMQESMQVGQTWGMQIGQKFAEKMAEKGLK